MDLEKKEYEGLPYTARMALEKAGDSMWSVNDAISIWSNEPDFKAKIVKNGDLFTAVTSHQGIFSEHTIKKVEDYLIHEGYKKIE